MEKIEVERLLELKRSLEGVKSVAGKSQCLRKIKTSIQFLTRYIVDSKTAQLIVDERTKEAEELLGKLADKDDIVRLPSLMRTK